MMGRGGGGGGQRERERERNQNYDDSPSAFLGTQAIKLAFVTVIQQPENAVTVQRTLINSPVSALDKGFHLLTDQLVYRQQA